MLNPKTYTTEQGVEYCIGILIIYIKDAYSLYLMPVCIEHSYLLQMQMQKSMVSFRGDVKFDALLLAGRVKQIAI